MSRISVVVAVYAAENYVCRCLDSLLNQTFDNLEIILLDDGSTDQSAEICDEYIKSDNRISVIHQRNGGVSHARNIGIDYSSGDFLGFVDADDYVKPNCYEVLHNTMIKKRYDCVAMGAIMVDNYYNEIKTVLHKPKEYIFDSVEARSNHIINQVLKGKTGWEIWSRLFNNRIIKNNNIMMCETSEDFAEDLSFYLVYLKYCNRICNLNYVGYYYYQRDDSMMNKTKTDIKLNAMNEVSKFFFSTLNKKMDSPIIRAYPTIHFLLVWDQLKKIVKSGNYDIIPCVCSNIKDSRWYKKNIVKVIMHEKYFVDNYDKKRMLFYRNLCSFTLHRKLLFFRIGNYYIDRIRST